jgi:hypothetical protein
MCFLHLVGPVWFIVLSHTPGYTFFCRFYNACIEYLDNLFTANDEGSKGQKITLQDEGRTITGKAAANALAKGYETENNTNIPLARKKEVRAEEREREQKQLHMTNSRLLTCSFLSLILCIIIASFQHWDTLPCLQLRLNMSSSVQSAELPIKKLKKKKPPGPDNITNEMLQHLGNSAL